MPINTADLNKKLQNLAKSIDTESLRGELDTISTKFKAFDLTEMGKTLGEVKGGFEGLTQNVANLAESIAGELDANGFPTGGVNTATIAKLDKSMQAAVPALKTALTNHSSDINALVSSAHGTASTLLAAAAPAAKELAGVAEGLMDDIITDGSPEAIAGVLKAKLNIAPQEIKNVLKEVANLQVEDIIDEACKDLQDFKLPADLGKTLDKATAQLDKALGGLNGGNILKAVTENFTKDIQNSIQSIASGFDGINSINQLKGLANTAISGNIQGVANELASKLRIPDVIQAELRAQNISIQFGSPKDVESFLQNAGNLNLSAAAQAAIPQMRAALTNLNDKIVNLDTSVTKSILPGGTPSRNPVVNPSTYFSKSQNIQVPDTAGAPPPPAGRTDGNFPFLNSEEEIVRYLQGATREITTVVWHWTAHYTDQGHIGSEQINASHIARGWNGIGYHFIVKRDGSIQVGRDINTTGAHVGGFNTRSIGISFVAGYKCPSTKYRGIPPHSEVGPESITLAQHASFNKFMSAWYKVYPGGQAWGHVDFPRNSGKVDPGFDVAARVYELFGKRNVGHPQRDNKCLTAAEIASKTQFA